MSLVSQKLLLITGSSTGFGRALAEAALAAGHRVVGTLRNEIARAAFDALDPGKSHGVLLDVTDIAAIGPTIAKIEAEIGPIDVLVNNAGYGHEGTFEESTFEGLRRQFEVNVFGAAAMMKAVLPSMRRRRSGRIVNITSVGGFITMPGLSFYHGSKFALEGISETLSKEVRDFGIFVTAVEPGGFRTDWAGRSMVRAPRTIEDYDSAFGPLRERRKAMSGRQLGDPAKAAAAILTLIANPEPPVHLLLGSDALALVREKITTLSREIDAWEELTRSTDFQ